MPYLANWASFATLDALRDDGHRHDSVSDLAFPCGVLLDDRTEPYVKALLALAWQEEYVDNHYPDEDGPLLDPDWELQKPWGEGDRPDMEVWWSPGAEIAVVIRSVVTIEPIRGPE